MGTTMARLLLAGGLLATPVTAGAAEQSISIIADACAGCHGTDARSPGSMPGYSDKNAATIKKALMEYKSGAKEATVMDRIVKGFTDAQLEALANHYGAGK